MGKVVHVIGSDLDIFTVFNEIQNAFTLITAWEQRLSDLATTGSFADMVRESLPILENRITIVDYDLTMLASCTYTDDGRLEVADGNDSSEPVPAEILAHFISHRAGSLSARDPYLIEDSPDGRCFCVNVFNNKTYAGAGAPHGGGASGR